MFNYDELQECNAQCFYRAIFSDVRVPLTEVYKHTVYTVLYYTYCVYIYLALNNFGQTLYFNNKQNMQFKQLLFIYSPIYGRLFVAGYYIDFADVSHGESNIKIWVNLLLGLQINVRRHEMSFSFIWSHELYTSTG